MAKTSKVALIQHILDKLYPNPPIPLNHRNGFTFLVAVVLSAQTTDGKVNQVTKELFARADNPHDMAKIPVAEIQRIIQPVGLAPRKAQYVADLSRQIIERHGGHVPKELEDLEALSGVGRKTASVIRSQLYGIPSFAVDTHVHRLALRWGLTKSERDPNKVQEDLCKSFPESSWDRLHLQMIYFGREFCPAKNHKPAECPICSWINRPLDEANALASRVEAALFTPQPRMKGLIYYHDRIAELVASPNLVASLPSSSGALVEKPSSDSITGAQQAPDSDQQLVEKINSRRKRQRSS